ncbi:hypothetical protein RCTIPTONUS_49 [Rhodobacter phage RcTiptonus]|nr:hypothetical protein RCTIPTONUS_49 [Rhodobacter phage RcTiptonus]
MVSLIFGALGSSLLGPIGGFIGSAIGSYIDNMLFAPKPADVEGPRLDDLGSMRSDVGVPIARVFGADRVAGNVLCSSELIEIKSTKKVGGKGGGKKQKVTTYAYYVDIDILLCKGPILGIGRVWADGKCIRGFRKELKLSSDKYPTNVGAYPYPASYAAARYDPATIPWSLDPALSSTMVTDGYYKLVKGVGIEQVTAEAAQALINAGTIVYWKDGATNQYYPYPQCVAFNGASYQYSSDYNTGTIILRWRPLNTTQPTTMYYSGGTPSINEDGVIAVSVLDRWCYIANGHDAGVRALLDAEAPCVEFLNSADNCYVLVETDLTANPELLLAASLLDREGDRRVTVAFEFVVHTSNSVSTPYKLSLFALGANGFDYDPANAGNPKIWSADVQPATYGSRVGSSGIVLPKGTRRLRLQIDKNVGGWNTPSTVKVDFQHGMFFEFIVEDGDAEAASRDTWDELMAAARTATNETTPTAYERPNGEVSPIFDFSARARLLGFYNILPSNSPLSPSMSVTNDIYIRTWDDYYNLFAALNDWSPGSIFTFTEVGGVTLYRGTDTQPPDPVMQDVTGMAVPSYKGLAHIVFDQLALADFGNRTPSLSFEVVRYENDRVYSVIETLCLEAGVPDAAFDLSQVELLGERIETYVAGYSIGNATTYRAVIEQLIEAFRLDAAEINNALVFRPIDRDIDHVLPYEDLGATEAGNEPKDLLQITRTDIMEMPQQLEAVFTDASRDYQTNSASYARREVVTQQKSATQLPIVSNPAYMRRWVEQKMRRSWVERAVAQGSLPHRRIYISPTDIIQFQKGDPTIDYALSKFDIDAWEKGPIITSTVSTGVGDDKATFGGPPALGTILVNNGLVSDVVRASGAIYESGVVNDPMMYTDIDLFALGIPRSAIKDGMVSVSFEVSAQQAAASDWGAHVIGIVGFGENRRGKMAVGYFGANDGLVEDLVSDVVASNSNGLTTVVVAAQIPAGMRFVRTYIRIVRADVIWSASKFIPKATVTYKYDPLPVYDGATMRVVSVTRGANGVLEIEGAIIDPPVRQQPIDYTEYTGGTSLYVSPAVEGALLSPTSAVCLNIPMLTEDDNNSGFYVAMTGTSNRWEGATLYRSTDGSSSFQEAAETNTDCTMGRVVAGGLLPNTSAGIPDMDSSVTVELYNRDTSLQSITTDRLFAGGNTAIIGNEIVSFLLVESLGMNKYRLYGGILRGRLGTDRPEYMNTHDTGERFVLLSDAAVVDVPDSLSNKNTPLPYKAVTFGGNPAEISAFEFTNTCERLKPFHPVHLTSTRNPVSGDLTISWTRQDRAHYDWADFADLPNSEVSEQYHVDILMGNTVLRTIEVDGSTQALYTAAEQALDGYGIDDTVELIVYQISATVGRGAGLKGEVK